MSTYAEFGVQRSTESASTRLGTVVVASDGSDASSGALTVGREIAHYLGTGLEVVSVIEPTNVIVPLFGSSPPPLHRGAPRIQDRRERLRALCGRVLAGEPRCATRILLGEIPSSIARAAQCHRAPLVVMGRVQHGRLERSMRRETPLATVRLGRVPVLSVGEWSAHLPRCIVVAVGSGEAAAHLVPLTRALFHDTTVAHLVSVDVPLSYPWEPESRAALEERRTRVEYACTRSAASLLLPANVQLDAQIIAGEPAAALSAFVAASGADLLVVGQERRTGGIHLPIADLATQLFRSVSCAILIVPLERPASADGGNADR